MIKFIRLFLAVLLLAACSKKNEETNLTIVTDSGDITYTVENAQTIPELEKGLMFRESLAPNTGMIFDLSHVKQIAMWMKNTKISLDMVFIDKDGVITWVFENATPESTNLIIPPFPAVAVLEINAGDIKKNNIKPGNIVKHEFFTAEAKDAPSEPVTTSDEVSVEKAPTDETPVAEVKSDDKPVAEPMTE